jgi:hypothetical protein
LPVDRADGGIVHGGGIFGIDKMIKNDIIMISDIKVISDMTWKGVKND